jgi:hypothetical protein
VPHLNVDYIVACSVWTMLALAHCYPAVCHTLSSRSLIRTPACPRELAGGIAKVHVVQVASGK